MSTKRGKGAILQWCQKVTQDRGIEIKNFTTSFADGLAFAAIIDSVSLKCHRIMMTMIITHYYCMMNHMFIWF